MALDHNAVVTELWRRINEALTIPLQTAATAASDALLAQIAAEAARDEAREYVDTELEKKADKTHTHTAQDVGAAPASHAHDDRYYTQDQADDRYISTAGHSTKTGDLNMDGGSVNYIRPDTSGGWARGFYWDDRDQTTIGGFGLFGNASNSDYFYLGHGESPWSASVLLAYQDLIRITNLEVTGEVTGIEADDVGAAPASHQHSIADVTDMGGITRGYDLPPSTTSTDANDIVVRATSGRIRTPSPGHSSDAANKSYVDAKAPWIGSQSAYNSETKTSGRLYVIT